MLASRAILRAATRPDPAEKNDARDERSPAHGPTLWQLVTLPPGIGRHQTQRGEHSRGSADGSVVRRAEDAFAQVSERGAGDDEEPRATYSDLARGQITKPNAGTQVGGEVGAVDVQCECGPRAPPLPAPQARRVQVSGIERIEPHEAGGDEVGNTHQTEHVRQGTDPGVGIQTRRWGRRRPRTIFGFILAQVRQGLGSIRLAYPENEAGPRVSHRALDPNGGQHEGALVARAPA